MNDGLGGAFYLSGSNSTITNSLFDGNIARNGSGIYSDETLFIMNNTILNNNQAWSYLIPINANPQSMPYGSKTNVTVLLYGGDNIANAIYSTKDVGEVYLHNVTYEYNDHGVIINRTTTDSEVHPIDGIENAIDEDGNLKGIYQDTRENNQIIIVTICEKYEDGSYSAPVRTYNLTTDVYGKVNQIVDETPLPIGNYTIFAEHPEDSLYKFIDNLTDIEVYGSPEICDVVVIKVANVSSVVVGDKVTWTISVVNNGPSVAENVVVRDVLPIGFVFADGSRSFELNIGDLASGDSKDIDLNTTAVSVGNWTNVVNVTTSTPENDTTNNVDNDTVEVTVNPICDISVVKVANVTKVSKGDLVTWTITVKNNGPSDAKDVFVKDILPKGFVVAGTGAHSYTWNIGTLKAGQKVVLTLKTKALEVGNWTNIVIINTTTPENDTDNNVDNATVTVVNKETPIHNNSTKHVKHKHNKPVYEKGIAMKHTGNALNLAAIVLLVLLCALFIRVNYRKE